VIIDVHFQLGSDGERTIKLPALQTELDQGGIDRALLAHHDHSESGQRLDEVDSNLACLRAGRREDRLCPLYWARPGHFDSNPYTCAGALYRERFLGLVLSPDTHGYELGDRDRIYPYMKALAHVQRPCLLWLTREDEEQAAAVYAFAQDWPRIPFLLLGPHGVLAGPTYRDLVQRGNKVGDVRLWLCTSHTPVDEIVHIVEVLGSGALMFGSDPGGDAHADESEQSTAEILEALRNRLSPDDFRTLVYENAADIFELRPELADAVQS
jgi:predicted TIM-barrel fold metal-dependent hydrolase